MSDHIERRHDFMRRHVLCKISVIIAAYLPAVQLTLRFNTITAPPGLNVVELTAAELTKAVPRKNVPMVVRDKNAKISLVSLSGDTDSSSFIRGCGVCSPRLEKAPPMIPG
jgi:hypothetical protein